MKTFPLLPWGCTVTSLTLFLTMAANSVRADTGLETFVMTVGGQSSYPTFGAPPPVQNHFGTIGLSIPSNPAGLAASGIGGGFQNTSQTNAPLVALYNLSSGNWTSSWTSANIYLGNAAANARYGQLGATASGTYNGWGDAGSVAGSESFAVFSDRLTITSPSVTAGSSGNIRLLFSVDGAMTCQGEAGLMGVLVIYKLGTSPSYTLVDSTTGPNVGSSFYPYSGPGRDGFVITATNVSGQGTFDTFDLPFTFGQAIDLKVGLLCYNIGRKNFTGNVNFGSTVKLTGVAVVGVTNFTIVSASGTTYGTNGVALAGSPVPEITGAAFDAETFRAHVIKLDPTRFYVLKRSDNLPGGFTTVVDGPRPPSNPLTPDTDDFIDPSPGPTRGFYRIESFP